ILQQLRAHHSVLRRAQAQAQRDLAAVGRDRQVNDPRLPGHYDAVPEQRHHLEPVQAPREVLLQPLPGPPHHGPTDGTLATAPGGPPARPPRDCLRSRASTPRRATAASSARSAGPGRETPRPTATSLPRRSSAARGGGAPARARSEEHTSELQSRGHLVCRLLLEKKKNDKTQTT